jgi:hypothetical protein
MMRASSYRLLSFRVSYRNLSTSVAQVASAQAADSEKSTSNENVGKIYRELEERGKGVSSNPLI